MGETGPLKVFGAAYDDAFEAVKDFEEIQTMHADREIGAYDGAIVTKEQSGALMVTNSDSSGWGTGAAKGAAAGAVLGAIFPPSILVMAAVGAVAGAAVGGAKAPLGRADMKDLGDVLEPGETGILVVTDKASDWAATNMMKRAKRKKSGEVEGDAQDIKDAIRRAAGY
jgi:uncharacterized membrane protein